MMPPKVQAQGASPRRRRKKTTVDDEGKMPRSLNPSLSHENLGITHEAFLILLWFQVPLEFLHVLAFVFMRPEYSNNSDLWLVECFCGVAAIVEAWQSRLPPAAGFDINHSALHLDLTLPHGICGDAVASACASRRHEGQLVCDCVLFLDMFCHPRRRAGGGKDMRATLSIGP